MNKKPTFFTSDWHIGHEAAIGFDKRPFKNLDEMHVTLVRRYNSKVPDSGICYFLGDIGNKTEEIRKVITQLKGTKICIVGNHDHGINTMYNCGFDAVIWGARLLIMKEIVTMSHCPLLDTFREDTSGMRGSLHGEPWHGNSRPKHRVCSVRNEGQFHLHGHIHSGPHREDKKKKLGRQFDIGVVGNQYTPVPISEVESWIAKTLEKEKQNGI